MSMIRQILDRKGRHIITAKPQQTVFEAIRTMAENNVGALIITVDDKIRGIFTERDYLRKIALKFRSSRETKLQDVMTSPVITVESTDDIERCMKVMTDNRCRHLPIMEAGQLVGIVSIGDLVKGLLSEKEEEVAQLSQYIQGSY